MFKKWIIALAILGSTTSGFAQKKALKVLVISDLNDSYGSVTYSTEVHEVVGKIKGINPDIILCGGDMVAGQKATLTEENIVQMWNGFDQAVLTPIQSMGYPFGFTVGNHDASPSYALDRKLASAFWLERKSKLGLDFVDDTHFPYFYSYKKGNTFFISWDASSAKIPEEVKPWMEEQLKSKAARKAKYRVVLGHLPLYALVASKNKPGEVIADADASLEFFKKNKVDIYISGHQHVFYPGYKSDVVLLNTGALGGGPRPLLGSNEPGKKSYTVLYLGKTIKMEGKLAVSHQIIPSEELPETVKGFNGEVPKWHGYK